MQVDFHHAVTYIAARSAGFDHGEAQVVAYCAQYVDDATNSGVIQFDTGAMYSRICSAHKMLDYSNLNQLANHHVWVPFHFLPGNGGQQAGAGTELDFVNKILCCPDSYVARDMVAACIRERNEATGLHRLGITMHVYADTWAHQGFAGARDDINDVKILDEDGGTDHSFIARLADWFGDRVDQVAGGLVGGVLPLGHGAALSLPDLPYLKWSYKRQGKVVTRDNTDSFVTAADEMCRAMQRYREGDPAAAVPGLCSEDKTLIRQKLGSITSKDPQDRHRQWLKAIKQGEFSFPAVDLGYQDKGDESWKHDAIGTKRRKDRKTDIFPYSPAFLKSHWKLFHDGLQAHRFTVLYEILPRYGICAA